MKRDCATCQHVHGKQCRRKPPLINSRTGEEFYPLASVERSAVDSYRGNILNRCGPQGIYHVERI